MAPKTETDADRKSEAAAAEERDKASRDEAKAASKRASARREATAKELGDPSRAAEHTAGGTTTRDDATDLGVPMLPGSPKESIGPEDALGEGPKRGDYSDRVGPSDYQPHETVPVDDAEPGDPTVKVVKQRPRASQQGEVAGRKGGVQTTDADGSKS